MKKKMPAWLVAALAALCGTLAFGEDAGAGEIAEFSPLNVGEVEQVAGASHSELREVAQASTNYTDAAVAAAVAYTTAVSNKVASAGYVTASVTNGLASAAALSAHASATNNPHNVTAAQVGALTAESDPSTGLTNYFPYVRGTEVARADWNCVKIGRGAFVMDDDYEIAIGAYAKAGVLSGIAIGYKATPTQWKSTAIGFMATTPKSVVRGDYGYLGFSAPIDKVYFNSYKDDLGNYSDARSLQSYLDERATTSDLAAVKAMISATNATFSSAVNVAARALVKSKLESLNKAKSSIGETIAALQSIYNETETK